MKNLKLKALSLGIVSTVLISSSAFAATPASNFPTHPITVASPTATTKSNVFASSRTYGTSFGRYMTAQQVIDRGGVIQEGDTGEPVAQIQRILGITDDGIFGSQTRDAVRRFQLNQDKINRANNQPIIAPDGIVGPQTWAYMK
ncbi:peptidoglycan-binding domain-containing protein [Clostridium felsineum]|uniref:Uncharacterized protein n=1 Tax=Clostridium felsineum TaxID=36839 RepID=A0A1S8L3B9_9CLOT|nr:peptidoglycan-binding protein [Clostridium felsineum]URZ07572.1 hypothetical protein CLROS_029110 [Clostridium felsineum]URZ12603.1 hypothetical protein CROST_033260 [Clostridium felsineum]